MNYDAVVIERVELGVSATAAIRELILSGEASAGQRLIEQDLAQRFGTSRGPVRDGLAALERAGLVFSVNRKGTFVIAFSPTDIDELYTLRICLESLAIERVVKRATALDLAELRLALEHINVAKARKEARALAEADMSFHRQIITLAQHDRLLQSWQYLADQTLLLMSRLSHIQPTGALTTADHAGIVDTIESGTAKQAAKAIRDHLTEARVNMLERYYSDEAGSDPLPSSDQ